jgi:two-component system chemotaxis sensor kinase CheA
MSISASVRERLLESFRAELDEHVQVMTDGLLALEQGRVPQDQRGPGLEEIFRAAHSLKGAARAMGVTAIEHLAHGLESILVCLREGSVQLSSNLCSACYRALDAVRAVQTAYEGGANTPPSQALQALAELEQIRSGADPPAQAGSSEPARQPVQPPPIRQNQSVPEPGQNSSPSVSEGPIRVGVSKLDALMGQLSELLVIKIRAERRLDQMRQLQDSVQKWHRLWLSARGAYNRVTRQDTSGLASLCRLEPVDAAVRGVPGGWSQRPVGGGEQRSTDDGRLAKDLLQLLNLLSESQEGWREVSTLSAELAREYANDTAQISLTVASLEEEVKRIRMLPLSTIVGSFGRMVRDLALEAGKDVALHISGAGTELDKQVLEQIKDPLIHLLRNAVDHGIEMPREREAAGKPPLGTVTLSAEQMGKDVVIRVSDDGAGLDLEAIRESLGRRLEMGAGSLTDAELVTTIFDAGVSTKAIITDISGRGVGLDIVRRNVEALHGRVDVAWSPGRGTTFTLTLPLALTGSRGLLVRVCGQLFVIPLISIKYIKVIGPEEILSLEGRDAVQHEGRPITLVWLRDVLGLPRSGTLGVESRIPVVVLSAAKRCMAFAVDELVGEQEVVIKGLGKHLKRVGGIAGGTLLGSGEVVLILNAADLIKLALRDRYGSVREELDGGDGTTQDQAPPRILIVDDSITTRTLEKNILEAAGYDVLLANDGREALQLMAVAELPDLIISDIVMPHLDGFLLTQRIKEDERTAHLPVVLVTSLDSQEDKARGIEVGADAYITKAAFDQGNLLEMIKQLI